MQTRRSFLSSLAALLAAPFAALSLRRGLRSRPVAPVFLDEDPLWMVGTDANGNQTIEWIPSSKWNYDAPTGVYKNHLLSEALRRDLERHESIFGPMLGVRGSGRIIEIDRTMRLS